MEFADIEDEVERLKNSGQKDYYLKIIIDYFDLIKDLKTDWLLNNIFENYIEEYKQIIIYFWKQREVYINKKTAYS